MRYYDGSHKWSDIEAGLRRDGYVLDFACAIFDEQPVALGYTGLETGWELRRKLKTYCATRGIADFKIVRNTSYHHGIHGRCVYELWTRQTPKSPEIAG